MHSDTVLSLHGAIWTVLGAGACIAQVDWTQHSTPNGPAGRFLHVMCEVPTRGSVLMFGGIGFGRMYLRDTWEWTGSWVASGQSGNAPLATAGCAMAYDPLRDVVVLFGGGDPGSRISNETWEWNGSGWSLLAPSVSPIGRLHHAMAFDGNTRSILLFGGLLATGPLGNDTWTYDGVTWRQSTPNRSPSIRRGHAVTWDSARRRVVLFGGNAAAGDANDTWEWDGSDWGRVATPNAPPIRGEHSMAYDEHRRRVVVFGGGHGVGGVEYDDTWEYDGIDWVTRMTTTRPSRRSSAAMGYDGALRSTILFGGAQSYPFAFHSDTYGYAPIAPASFVSFGQACAGAGTNAPLLSTSSPGALPWIGDTLVVTVSGVTAGSTVWMLTGFSRTSWSGIGLPLRLDPYGLPGCTLYVSLDIVVGFVAGAGGGAAEWRLTVPVDAALVGLRFYEQAVVAAPGANPAGAVVSDAAAGVVGAR